MRYNVHIDISECGLFNNRKKNSMVLKVITLDLEYKLFAFHFGDSIVAFSLVYSIDLGLRIDLGINVFLN